MRAGGLPPALAAYPVMNRINPYPLDRQRHRCDVKIPGERVLCVRPAVRCSDCGFGNPEGARFCAGCSARLAQRCPACGSTVQADHQYCAACGRRLAAWGRGERDATAVERLRGLRAHAERAGLRNALAALEAALGPEGRETLASA
jgi:hypothetical protein